MEDKNKRLEGFKIQRDEMVEDEKAFRTWVVNSLYEIEEKLKRIENKLSIKEED